MVGRSKKHEIKLMWPSVKSQLLADIYHIAGNFHMVQNFVDSVDRSATMKIRTMKFSIFIYC